MTFSCRCGSRRRCLPARRVRIGGRSPDQEPLRLALPGLQSAVYRQGRDVRNSRIRAFIIPDVTRGTLHGAIQAHVEPGSTIYTDAWHCYRGLVSYTHYVVNHDVE
jgi:hypothetical protein